MTTRQLELIAARGRRLGMEMVFRAASGHIGGSLSAMDILTELYFEELRVDTAEPKAPGRDRFVMSKGHCTPALYSILAQRGFFPEKQLELFRSIEGHMSGHPDMVNVPGVDMSTGSLGQGLSAAVGMAIAGKLANDFPFAAKQQKPSGRGMVLSVCARAYGAQLRKKCRIRALQRKRLTKRPQAHAVAADGGKIKGIHAKAFQYRHVLRLQRRIAQHSVHFFSRALIVALAIASVRTRVRIAIDINRAIAALCPGDDDGNDFVALDFLHANAFLRQNIGADLFGVICDLPKFFDERLRIGKIL